MSQNETISYNALALIARGEYRVLKNLWDAHGSWERALQNLTPRPPIDVRREWEKLESFGITLLLSSDAEFPPELREIPWPPFGIYLRGALSMTDLRIAIVGTRNATPGGKKFAGSVARALALRGITVVSGLAFGIDAAAHTAVTEVGGRTVAVLATGLDQIYPREHERFAVHILEKGGALVSEYPIGSPSLPRRFLERNRIVSGLSRGILVVEAPESSGALATARFALEQNREVFVSPGPPEHPNYIGSNELIKTGATLVTGVNDILNALNLEGTTNETKERNTAADLDGNEKAMLNVLKAAGAPLGAQAIAERASLPVPLVNRTMSFLVIRGIVNEIAGKYISKV